MNLDSLFNQASSIMTLLSFLSFLGIVGWAWSARNKADFAQAAQLPFADADEERNHG